VTTAITDLPVRAARSSLWTLLSQVIQLSIGALSFALLAKWLGPADYGLVGMASTATGLVGTVGDAGMVAAVMREKEINLEVESTASWIACVGGLTLCALTALASPFLGYFYKNAAVVPLAVALSLTFAINAPAYVARAKLSRQLDFRRLAIATAAGSVVALTAAYIIARQGGGPWTLVANLLLGLLVQSVLINIWAWPNMRLADFSWPRAKAMGTFSRQLSTFSLAIIVGRTADSVLTGRYLGGAALGTLTMAMLLIGMPVGRICVSISSVFLPTLLELPTSEARGRAFASLSQVTMFVLVPLCLGTLAIAPELVAVFPDRWRGVTHALQITSAGLTLEPIGYLCVAVLSAQGRTSVLSRVGIFLLPVSWAGAIVGVSLGSVNWVLFAWAVVNIGGAAVLLALVWRSLHLGPWFLSAVLTPVAGAILMVGAVRTLLLVLPGLAPVARLPLGIACGSGVYLAFGSLFLRGPMMKIISLLRRSVQRC
jgi:O-antigen/teichoic acid export membrane protein